MLLSAAAITIVIQFANLADVPPAAMREAQESVVEMLADIDVTVQWVQASASTPGGSHAIRLTMLPYEGGALRSHDRSVMGAATRTALGTGVAWVYYQRVLEESARYAVHPARLLACVMAHEIGHLVLASPIHERDGLMRAAWSAADFRRASIGQLRFATEVRRQLRLT